MRVPCVRVSETYMPVSYYMCVPYTLYPMPSLYLADTAAARTVTLTPRYLLHNKTHRTLLVRQVRAHAHTCAPPPGRRQCGELRRTARL